MARPIYKVYLFKPTEAWYQLPDDKKDNFRKQLAKALKKVGGKEIVECFSGWNSEQYLGWGSSGSRTSKRCRSTTPSSSRSTGSGTPKATATWGPKFPSPADRAPVLHGAG